MAITKEEVVAKVSAELIASRDCQAIAAAASVGRKRSTKREIGYGTILETVGFVAGNAVCDEINNNPMYRYVKPLVEQGRMLIGSPMVAAALQAMVPAVIPQAVADKLKALGLEDDPVTAQDVAIALYNPDGSDK
jgi:hypothetical protein